MIRWILGKPNGKLILLSKFQHTLHELRAPTVVFRSIINIDDECLNRREAIFHAFPPIHKPIHETVAGYLGCHSVQKELVGDGEENPHRGDGGFRLKIMVSSFGQHATLASSCKGTDFDRGFGIQRNP